jgi:integrase
VHIHTDSGSIIYIYANIYVKYRPCIRPVIRPKMSPVKSILAANSRLKSGAIGLAIETKNNRLVLRGILPVKPNIDRPLPYEQKVYLGYPVTLEAIKQAEKDALSIRASIIEKRFDWLDWSKELRAEAANPVATVLISDWAGRFEHDYFTRRVKDAKSISTFTSEYLPIFRKLPQDQELSEAVIMAAIATTVPETRQRKRYVMALSALAKFAGLNIDIKSYGRGYTPAKLEVRNLPHEEEIIQYHGLIPNLSWQNAYALMATFGIRPHEIALIDLSELPNLQIHENTKTGYRIAKPFPPEWVEQFKIHPKMDMPKITGRTNQDLGDRVGTQFKRYGVPFPPYNLRHAFAVRASIKYEMPVALVAKILGHSVVVHQATYLRHMSQDIVDEVYDKTIKKFDGG